MLYQAPQFVVPELVLDANRQNEEENAKKHETKQIFSYQVPTEWALKNIFTCNHSTHHTLHNSIKKKLSQMLLANTADSLIHYGLQKHAVQLIT